MACFLLSTDIILICVTVLTCRETMEKRKKDLMDESKELDKEGQRQKQTCEFQSL